MSSILKTAKENPKLLKKLKSHIAMGLNTEIDDNSIELKIRIAEIDEIFEKLINETTSDNENDSSRDQVMEKLLTEKIKLKQQLEKIETSKINKQFTETRLNEIYSVIDLLQNHPLTYDDQVVRDVLECIVVESKDKIKVVFKGGLETIAIM